MVGEEGEPPILLLVLLLRSLLLLTLACVCVIAGAAAAAAAVMVLGVAIGLLIVLVCPMCAEANDDAVDVAVAVACFWRRSGGRHQFSPGNRSNSGQGSAGGRRMCTCHVGVGLFRASTGMGDGTLTSAA